MASTASPADATPGAAANTPGQVSSIAGIGLSPEAAAAAAAAATAAVDGAAPAAATSPASVDCAKGSGRQRKRLQQLESKLQVYMDHEDRRVKELTEGVLYELLPAVLNAMLPSCEDPLTELDPERCRAAAGAALAASALMNAPPGFLEFLLCIPWRRLPQLYPSTAAGKAYSASAGIRAPQPQQQGQQQQQQPDPQQELLAESAADEAERRLLVNMPLHPQLVRPVLLFMYKPQHEASVPPVLRPDKRKQPAAKPQPPQPGQQQAAGVQQQQQKPASSSLDCTADDNLMAVAEALLDGATPLHCAALRGNPAQVDHLLFCGADPTRKTAVGDLPLQLVPRCGGYSKATHTCTCLGPAEQEVWECRSRIARTLIASKCLTAFRVGVMQYLSLLWLCLMAFLGLNLGAKAAMVRLLAHMQRREEQQAEEARVRTTAAVEAMRQEAHLGQAHLTLAKQQIGSSHLAQHQHTSSAGGAAAASSSSSSGGSSSLSSGSVGAGALAGRGVAVDAAGGPYGQLGYERAADVGPPAAAPRPVATAAAAAVARAGAEAGAGGGQEPVAPGTPSASEEAAAAYSAAAKGRKGAAGSLRWSASGGAAGQELAGLESAGSSSSGSSSPSLSHQADGSRGTEGQGSSRNSGLPVGFVGSAVEAGRREHAHRQQLLRELLSAANTSAAEASPTVAAAAALAVDAEHAWHDPADSLPLTEQAQTVFSEVAFKCFVRAVHALQRLNLQEDCTPLAVSRADKGDAAAAAASTPAAAGTCADIGAAAAAPRGVTPPPAGVTAAVNAKLKAAAAASGVAGPLPRGLAAAMTLDAVGSTARGTAATAATTAAAGGEAAAGSFPPAAGVAGGMRQHVLQPGEQQLCVLEDEQANLYCCWAESVLLKHNSCACAGCTALAVHAIRMAHIAVVRLFNKVHKQRVHWPLRWRAVGRALSRIVYVHVALMCRTEAPTSPSKASVWRAQQCLSEWDQLVAAGLAGGVDQKEAAAALTVGFTVEDTVELLRLRAKTAESDLLIAEALLGSRLSSLTTLDEALAAAFVTPVPPIRSVLLAASSPAAVMPGGSSTSCLPVLVRPVSTALLNELQSARGLAVCPSPVVKQLAAQVADATAAELSAGARLRELLAGRIPPSTAEGMAALAAGFAAAEPFSSLAADVETARELYSQSCARAEVATQLQNVVDKVSRLTSRVAVTAGSSGANAAAGVGSSAGRGSGSGGGRESDAAGDEALGLPLQGFSVSDWQQYVSMLEAAVEPAKDANVSVTKARKLIKELQAQLAAAEAAAVLTSCMSRRPCGSNALKSAIAKAEAAAPAVSGTATTTTMAGSSSASGAALGAASASAAGGSAAASSSCVFSELLVVRLQAAKKRLEVERAAEVLHKAAVTYKNVADLPKLETAVLNARKLGAEDLAPDEYKAASELRARLTGALRVKQQLEGALKGLASMSVGTGPRGRQLEQLAEPVEAAIKEAARCEELLPGEAARATELLEAWRTSSACEAKLSRALRDGCGAATLSRLITETAAAGVKVTSAKRILKLQQALESAVAAAIESAASAAAGAGHGQLVARLEAAETGGVAPAVLLPARQLLRKLLAVEARQAVEAALKPHSDWSVNMRISTLRAALDKAEEALGCSMQELEEQQQQDRHPGGDVPQQQDQQQKGGADAAAADAVQQGSKQQHRRSCGSAVCSTSGAGSAGSKGGPQQQQHQVMRADSLAGSESCSEASSLAPSSTAGGGSTAGDMHAAGSSSGRPVVVGGGESEVMMALQELSLRAWQLLQQDQQQLEERERERLEQERARRERERKERQRAAAERAERGKAERETAAQERRAARAKAAAERAKAFTVVFGTSAVGASLGSSAGAGGGGGSTGGSAGGTPGAAGGSRGAASKRDASRQSIDSASGGAQTDAEGSSSRRVAPAGDADAAGANGGSGAAAAAAARASPAKRANAWGKQPLQQQQQQAASTAGKPSRSRGAASPAAAVAKTAAAAPSEADLGAAAADAEGMTVPLDVAVAVAHARCDSYDILGDEHSKLGLDMLALLESPEDAGPSSTTAAQQAALLRSSGSLDVPAPVTGGMQQPTMQQGAMAGDLEATAATAAGAASQQGGTGSHPATTPRFNLVDLGGASWGTDAAEGLVQPLKQRPASAGGCIMSLSPASAAAARATAAMDTAVRQSLELQLQQPGGVGSGQANIWRSPLGLGIDNPSMLPPLAPRSQQLQLRHGSRAGTEDGSGGALHGGLNQGVSGSHQQQHQQLQLLQGANSFDPVTSPAGRISPVGCAVSTLGPVQVPAPAFMYRQGMGLSSPRSYPQLQHAHPSLLQHQLAAHSSAGGASLLPSFEEGCVTQTAVAISSMCGSSEPLWLLQQQAQLQQQQRLGTPTTTGLLGASSLGQGATASCFSSLPHPALAVSDALQLHFEQLQFEQQQQQQYKQRQDGGDLVSAAGGVSAALLPPSLSVPLAAQVSSGMAPSPAPLVSQGGAAGGVGALSSSFAFGAPYSSSFSPAPMRGSSSLGGAAAAAGGDALTGRCPSGGLLSHQGSCVLGGGAAGVGTVAMGGSSGGVVEGSGEVVHCAGGAVSRPELLLPEDLNFSPPSSGPARWMQE